MILNNHQRGLIINEYKNRQAAARDPITPEIQIRNEHVERVVCGACRVPPIYEISAYAFSRGKDYDLVFCPSCQKAIWLKIID